MIKKIDHMVITTAKPEECIRFYRGLGFSVHEDGGRYALFAGDFKINVHMKNRELAPHAKHVQTGSADFCLEIDDDIEAFKKNIEAKGYKIELGIVERHGAGGTMRSVYLRDPDENLVEFCSYQ